MNEKIWLTPEEVERIYGFSKSWQAKARMRKSCTRLPYYKIGYKFIRYKKDEIENWLDDYKFQ